MGATTSFEDRQTLTPATCRSEMATHNCGPLQLGKMSFWPPIQNSEIIFPLEAVFSMATGFQDVLCFVYISIKWIQY